MSERKKELNALRVADLKELLRDKELPVGGRKAELIDRLLEFESKALSPETEETEQNRAPDAHSSLTESNANAKSDPDPQTKKQASSESSTQLTKAADDAKKSANIAKTSQKLRI